jgi:hypothetical protein
LDPFPFISGDCVVEGFSKFFKSNLDFIVGEGTTVVSVKSFESFMGESFGDASFSLSLTSWGFIISSFFSSEMAEVEVSEDGVSESEEFFLVNFTWGLGVNSSSGFFDPFPFISGDDVVLGFSELLKSSFDFTVVEGFVMVGIKMSENF